MVKTLLHIRLIMAVYALASSAAAVHHSRMASDASTNDDNNWPGYGRTYGQQHFSPLAQIDQKTVHRLGLLWSMDLGPENSVTEPIEVDGILYFATGLSVVHALDAETGRRLWSYDPHAAERSGANLRLAWGTRGIAWWDKKIYAGTADGRLIALDATNGRLVWSATTFDSNFPARISGAPRVFDGKALIGFGGTTGAARGFVTAYDAETGKKLWRFYTVPGNPADGFESRAMEMASKTWAGNWWRFGGGGDVWNALSYDPETKTVFLGTGSGYPWNRRARSHDQGDNLFVASIVALDVNTGAYKWHYQVSPGDTWDHDATMDIELADLVIDGKLRKVLLQAPKNGFFYVIDRLTGKLISAEPYSKVTWASRINLQSGRPVEAPGARYPNGTTANIWPSGAGAHNWLPMAYSPKTEIAYIPQTPSGAAYSDNGIDLSNWQPPTDRAVEGAVNLGSVTPDRSNATDASQASLIAWNPVTQRAVWTAPYPTYVNGGVLATGGNLVFQGTIDNFLRIYSAKTGDLLWSFNARAPLIAAPISYELRGKQQVTVLTGLGMGLVAAVGELGDKVERYGIDPRTQARRVLTFALDGKQELPPARTPSAPPLDIAFVADEAHAKAGETVYARDCIYCHGASVIASIHAPDLRRSSIPLEPQVFEKIVRGGAMIPGGMPGFEELSDKQLADLRQYIRTEAKRLRSREDNNDSRRSGF
jgi:quinohemoprotein ethanol dehydrogenase